MSHRGLTYAEQTKALREELIHGKLDNTDIICRGGLNARWAMFFYPPGIFTRVNPDNNWTVTGLLLPAAQVNCYVASKESWKYGVMWLRTMLPVVAIDGQGVVFGFEGGAGGGTGLNAFHYYRFGGATFFQIWSLGYDINILFALPVAPTTTEHEYMIQHTGSQIEYYIDRVLRGIVLNGSFTWANIAGPPYVIGKTNQILAHSLPAFLELSTVGADLNFPISPYQARVSHSGRTPARRYPLYDAGTDTLFAGLVIAAGSETSHPIPVFGYRNKTLFFQATGAGTLLVEVLAETGNWRTYDTIAVAANTLVSYIVDASMALARITFTPTAYPTTISEAEMVLGGGQ